MTSKTAALYSASFESKARIITSDQEALAIARQLATRFAEGASDRDRNKQLPIEEIELYSESGLWGITIPRSHGGVDASHLTQVEVLSLIAEADSSIAQIPSSHYVLLDGLKRIGTEEQKNFFFAEVLAGRRIGNAFAEAHGRNMLHFQTVLKKTPDGLRLTGRKSYTTGALFAHWVPVSAHDDDGNLVYAYIRRDSPGLTIVDDWDGIGQRTTASGTVLAEDVAVDPAHVINRHKAFDRQTSSGAYSQILHAAVDLGIARAAFKAGLEIARTARPWVDSGVERANEDPYLIAEVGHLQIQLSGAAALLERAARLLDTPAAERQPTFSVDASIAVAEARVATAEVALKAGSQLFEWGGTRSAMGRHNLDRHWRNARIHTLHDPLRWKFQVIGNYALNDVPPATHVWI